MCERLYKEQDHRFLAQSLTNMGSVLEALGQEDRALRFYERALAVQERLCKDRDDPHLAFTLTSLGSVLRVLGRADKGLPFSERALKMSERLYRGRDHPVLAGSLDEMGCALRALGQAEKALPYHERALQIDERLYKDQDHPDLARSLLHLGHAFRDLEQPDKALPFAERGLQMRERLYKDMDHPQLAQSIIQVGAVLFELRQTDKALPYFERALKMRQRLYKDQDHPELAESLMSVGVACQVLGQSDKALSYYEQHFRIITRILDREARFAPEAQALDRLHSLADRRDMYLWGSRFRKSDPDRVAEHLWLRRAIVTRILERRHHFVSPDTDEVRALRDKLAGLRARLSAALLRPTSPQREQLLREITEDKEKAERDLLQLVPAALAPAQDITPQDLAGLLPQDAAYLDLLRYQEYENGKPRLRYVAFVHRPSSTEVNRKASKTIRLDLGWAQDIDAEANAWRALVLAYPGVPEKDRPAAQSAADQHAARLRERVWDKIAPNLPKETSTIYLTVEGDLGRFPFAALPGDPPTSVLLEKYAFVSVPHGPALVQRLRSKLVPDSQGRLLAVGGVDFGTPAEGARLEGGRDFAPLPGTTRERAQLEKLGGGRVLPILGGTDATTTRLLAELPKVTYAHLGTHGQFKATLFEQDRQAASRYQELLKTVDLGEGLPARSGLGTRSPLGYVGLVLAGANTPEKAGPDGGILSGEAIAGLQLEGLYLVVLSACETGLGANTDTEGVRGLQRAFHLAGCPNVVASLWEVNDEATAALMNAFWERVLVEKKEPQQALREAQLLLYRRPDLVPTLANRGAPDFGATVKVNPQKSEPEKVPEGHRALHPYFWAPFFLSASGR
jgi:CHAT domain-containing protein/tetratricopeptide (TPR) repeat protein